MARRKDKNEEKDDDDIVMIEEDEKDDEESEDEESSDDSKKKEKDKEDDSDEEDERVGHGEDDEDEDEEEKEKSRKRESSAERRARQKKAKERNERELSFLRQRNEQLERRFTDLEKRQSHNEVQSVDQRIVSIQSQIKVADQVLAKAHESGSGEDVVEAQNLRDKLRDNLSNLQGFRREMARRASEREDEPEVDSRLIHNARSWMRENSWYDPEKGDRDSRRAAAIDARMVQEGFDPRTEEYWDEFTDRCHRAMPHLRKPGRSRGDDIEEEDEDRDSRRRQGPGPRFSTGGRERPLRKNEVYVSPERKQAMMDAGVWEDKVLRNKMLKRYAEYDRDTSRGRRN